MNSERNAQIKTTLKSLKDNFPLAYNQLETGLVVIDQKKYGKTNVAIKIEIGNVINSIPEGVEKQNLLELFKIPEPSFEGIDVDPESMLRLMKETRGGNRKYKRKSFRKRKSRQRRTRSRK